MSFCNDLRTVAIAMLLWLPGGAIAQDLTDSFHQPRSAFLERETLPKTPVRRFGPDNLARILVVGDSLAQGFGTHLEKRVKDREIFAIVSNEGRPSTGLSRQDFFDWPVQFETQAPGLKPDIVVAHFGTNDNQAMVTADGQIRQTSEEWDQAYRAQVRRVLDVAAQNRAVLYWLGPAPDRGTSLNRHMTRINPIIEAEARAAHAVFLPLSTVAADADGGFAKSVRINGKSVRIRAGDGSHFTGAGYYLVVDTLLEDMESRIPSLFGARQLELARVLQ